MSFSERSGVVPPRPIQRASMDGPLRNGLWNATCSLLERIGTSQLAFIRLGSGGPAPVEMFTENIWVNFHGNARDQFNYADPVGALRERFYQAPWHAVYDLIDVIASLLHDGD